MGGINFDISKASDFVKLEVCCLYTVFGRADVIKNERGMANGSHYRLKGRAGRVTCPTVHILTIAKRSKDWSVCNF